jgi:hypothetical protein
MKDYFIVSDEVGRTVVVAVWFGEPVAVWFGEPLKILEYFEMYDLSHR